jgi:hypothetical protein
LQYKDILKPAVLQETRVFTILRRKKLFKLENSDTLIGQNQVMCELIRRCLILVVTSSHNRADAFDDASIDQIQSGGCRAGDFVRSQ